MKRKLSATSAAALVIATVLAVMGPAPAASAQLPDVPNVAALSQLLSSITSGVYGALGTPSANASLPADATIRGRGESIFITLTYSCSGLFLPVAGLEGPRTIEVTVTQAGNERPAANVTKGFRQGRTPICDGLEHATNLFVPADYGQFGFQQGIATAEVTMSVCDLRGCARANSGRLLQLAY